MHTRLIAYSATAPSTGAAAAAVAGDSLVIENSKSPAKIIAWWADHQTAGTHGLTFPSGHDTTRGILCRVPSSDVEPIWPLGHGIQVFPQEQLSITIVGSATAGDVESGAMLLFYEDLPGVHSRQISYSELMRRAQEYVTVDATIAATAGPAWSGSELINAESDLLHANTDYAVLGMTCTVECLAVALRGPDTGNVRVGMPGNDSDFALTQDWFPRLSRMYGDEKLIPVINSGNRASTFLEAAQDENGADPIITLYLAKLK